MADTREQILSRLESVLANIVSAGNVFRNRLDIPESRRPAFVILDADEVADEAADGRGRRSVSPIQITMNPEIYILLGTNAALVGEQLNTLRIATIKAVLSDASLIDLCSDGDIRYLGFATGLASGRSMEGEAGISFGFRYIVQPTKL